MNWERDDPGFALAASACIPNHAVLPRAFTTSNLPAFLFASIGSHQMVASIPADDKPQTMIKCQGRPRTASKAAIPDVDDLPTPSSCHLAQDLAFCLSFLAGFFSSGCPPTQMGEHRSTLQTGDQQLQPIEPRHKDRTPLGWIEITRFDPFQASCFCGTNRTQPFRLQALTLLQDAFVPDHIDFLLRLPQCFDFLIGSFPQIVHD